MSNNTPTALLFSVLLHICVFLVLLLAFKNTTKVHNYSLVEIEIYKTQKTGVGDGRHSSKASGKMAIKKLLPSYNFKYDPKAKREKSEIDNLTTGSAMEVGLNMGVEAASENLPSLQWLFDRINSQLSYPDLFVRYEKSGVVQISLVLKKNGTPAAGTVRVNTSNHLLKVYVLQVLDNVFSAPLVTAKHLPQKIKLQLNFHFLLINVFHHYYPPKSRIINNTLTFYRTNQGTVPLEGIATEAPDTPKGARVDILSLFYSAMEAYDKYQKRKQGVDPFAIYKSDSRYDRVKQGEYWFK